MKSSKLDTLISRITPEQRDRFTAKTGHYIRDEYDVEIGAFDLEEILTFLAEEVGALFYNQGVQDGRDYIQSRFLESYEDSISLEIIE